MSDGVLSSVFGRVTWAPPPWLQRLGVRRASILLLSLAFLVLLVLGIQRYYAGLPQPPALVAQVTPPALSEVREDALVPAPLVVGFSVATDPEVAHAPITSVAALEQLEGELTEGVTLTPALDGRWRWADERTLMFEPAEDWPAGVTYTVRYDAPLFAPNLDLGDGKATFRTPDFALTLDSLEFYQNPAQPSDRKVVAAVRFSHPVDPDTLKKYVTMQRREAGDTVSSAPIDVDVTILPGPHGRSAYFHSEPLRLPESEVYLEFNVAAGVAPASGQGAWKEAISERVRIPDRTSYFRVDDVRAQLVRDENDDPVQTLSLAFTDRVTVANLAQRLSVYRLPVNPTIDGTRRQSMNWRSPREVTDDVLAQAQRINVTLNPVEGDAAMLHSVRLNEPERAHLYVRIEPGLSSTGDFEMAQAHDDLVRLPRYPREARIAREGGLLPLTGTRRLTLIGRGVGTLKVEVRRVLDGALHHLVSQTRGDIRSAAFQHWQFDEDNLTSRDVRYVDVNASHPSRATYAQFDMSDFVPDGGVYLVNVQGWDRQRGRAVGRADQRLVLITDLGILAKRSADGRHNVFVHGLRTGQPVTGAKVTLLGKNGRPVLERLTDAQGHASTPSLNGMDRERTPVVWIVRNGQDSVFLPYQRHDRQLQYSRFDVGGDYASAGDDTPVRAFLFTDRGLYRPGETVRLAAVVKRDDWGALAALPVVLRVTDPRGSVVHEHRARLASDGLLDRAVPTEVASATGNYYATLFVVESQNRERHLGNVAFRVEEFQPDRLRMAARIDGTRPRGWVQPGDLALAVQLDTLFGAPAQDRRIAATLDLVPSGIRLDAFPDYRFDDPLRRDGAPLARVSNVLPDARTDDAGRARLPLDLSRYDGGIYQLNVDVEGFEEGGGRSVRARTSVMMSPLDTLVGYRSDSDLEFLNRDTAHDVQFVGVNPDGDQVAVTGLTRRLVAYRYVSTLVQRPNGTYAYQSVRKETLVSEEAFELVAAGARVSLPTTDAGQFALQLVDQDARIVASVDFTVAGARNLAGNLERDAQLELVLNNDSFSPGQDIEVQVTAPYTGTGLITIERDRVHAHAWFRTDTTTSVQRIRVPPDLEGNAYINVAFVRDLDSPDVFVSPLSYAVAPFCDQSRCPHHRSVA